MDLSLGAPHARREAALHAEQPAAQLRYAQWVEWGTRIGLLMLALAFVAYLTGWLTPRVAAAQLPALWHLPVAEFRRATHQPVGWAWLALVQHGDMAALLGIAALAGCSIFCLLAMVPLYARDDDRVFVGLCLAEVAVLLLAASGVLVGGH